MSPYTNRLLALSVIALAFLSAPALADTTVVNPTSDVQAAINSASPGDTIIFKKGEYRQLLVIPSGKDALTLRGRGKAILDGRTPEGTGPIVTVNAKSVTIQNLTIRHPASTPQELDDILLDAIGILGNAGAQSLTIKRCKFFNCADGGVVANADDVTVMGNQFDQNPASVAVIGHRAVVMRNRITANGNNQGVGVLVVGPEGQIIRNKILFGDNGIRMQSDLGVIQGNILKSVGDVGIQYDGENGIIVRNKIDAAELDGIALGQVKNPFTGSQTPNFEPNPVPGATKNALVERNRVLGGGGPGIRADEHVTFSTFRRNFITAGEVSSVSDIDPAFEIFGDDNTFEKNVVKKSSSAYVLLNIADDGDGAEGEVLFTPERNVFIKNRAFNCARDGVYNEGLDTVLDGNRILRNQGEGIENAFPGTMIIRNNRSIGNRTDFANTGAAPSDVTDQGNNDLGTVIGAPGAAGDGEV